jgi:hypothetical protein
LPPFLVFSDPGVAEGVKIWTLEAAGVTWEMPVCDAVAEGWAPEVKHCVFEPSPVERRSGDVSPLPDGSLYISTNAVPAGMLSAHVVDLELVKGG